MSLRAGMDGNRRLHRGRGRGDDHGGMRVHAHRDGHDAADDRNDKGRYDVAARVDGARLWDAASRPTPRVVRV